MSKHDFYKNKKSDKVYWVDNMDSVGQHLFSFDMQIVFNLNFGCKVSFSQTIRV